MVEQEDEPKKQLSRKELLEVLKHVLKEYGPAALFSLISFGEGIFVEDTFDLVRKEPNIPEKPFDIVAYFSEKDIAEGYEVVIKVIKDQGYESSREEDRETKFLNVFTVNFAKVISWYIERAKSGDISPEKRDEVIKLLATFQIGLQQVLGESPKPPVPDVPNNDDNA